MLRNVTCRLARSVWRDVSEEARTRASQVAWWGAPAGAIGKAPRRRSDAHVSELSCLMGHANWRGLARRRLFVCCVGARLAER